MEQALAQDAKNAYILWADAISKEMKNLRVAYEVLPDGKSAISGRMVLINRRSCLSKSNPI